MNVNVSKSQLFSRRQFLQRSCAFAGPLLAFRPQLLSAAHRGPHAPSQRIRVGLIGIGKMGSGHLNRMAGDPGVEVRAVCEVDETRLQQAQDRVVQIVQSRTQTAVSKPHAYVDYRDLLARDDIDAVIIATPDHWHAKIAIDAARAGKDIYLEKPVSVTVEEGRRIVEAVQRHGRVFQTGTQYRSIPAIRKVCEFVRSGGLGKIHAVFTQLFPVSHWLRNSRYRAAGSILDPAKFRNVYTPVDFALPEEPVPKGLHWDLWVGPAPWRPYNHLYHQNPAPGVVPWSFDWAFGVTSSTWFLSHAADVIQYALGVEQSGPVEILLPRPGGFPTLTMRYANGTLLHFIQSWREVIEKYHAVPEGARLAGMFGGVFVGERGWVTSMTNGGRIEGSPPEIFEEMGLTGSQRIPHGNNHHANWLQCIRTRQKPSAWEELGHRAASIGHLVNIALWTGQDLEWDPDAERFLNSEAANRLLSRPTRNPWTL